MDANNHGCTEPGLGQIEILKKPDYIPKYLENVTLAYQIKGRLDVDALHAAFDVISRRHEEIRVTFRGNEGGDFSRFVREPLARYHFVPESPERDSTTARDSEWVAAEIRREAFNPIELSVGPILRYRLIPISRDSEWLLLVTVHHIVFDGWSKTVFQREISEAYGALIKDHQPEFPKLARSYHDCVTVQRRKWERGGFQVHEDYWRETFASLCFPLSMPWGRDRPTAFSFRGDQFEFSIESHRSAIDAFSRANSCSSNYLLLAAFFVLFERRTGQRDICIRSPMANRKNSSREGIVGYFVQPGAYRVVLNAGVTYVDVVRRLNRSSLDVWANAELPPQFFEACAGVTAGRSYVSPFQLHFNYQPFSPDLLRLDGVDVRKLGVPLQGVKTDLSLSISQGEKSLSGAFGYYSGIFRPSDMEILASDYLKIIEEMIANPEKAVVE